MCHTRTELSWGIELRQAKIIYEKNIKIKEEVGVY
tara:strand:- start:213 stop:317 length:105 start_codon:yes stop_codon:yes gene_type:complete